MLYAARYPEHISRLVLVNPSPRVVGLEITYSDRRELAELRRHHHHMTNVARALGLERSHLYKKCQQLGIDLRSERKS